MDVILSEFVARTSADPGLATDLLEAHEWNLHSALSAYYVMKGILPGEVPPSDAEIAAAHGKKHSVNQSDDRMVVNSSNAGSRPPLKKLPAFDFEETDRKLTRGISRATDNFTLVSQARKELAEDFDTVELCTRPASLKLELPEHSFSLPDFSVFPENLKEYLQRDLIETATLVSLEQAGRLNWWHSRKIGRKLWPLSTTGDGNCLLHAASLGMWGFHDRLLTLRKALHSLLMNSSYTDAFYRRWRWQTALQNKEAGLIYCEEEWEREWKNLLKLSSSEPRQSSIQRNLSEQSCSSSSGTQSSDYQSEVYESLEEMHVLALAHVLKRAIIIISDTVLKDVTGEPFAPIPFGGIYLPLECPASECHRSPLCLTFDSAHFSALVPMDEDNGNSELPAIIPVTDPDNKLLPLQFAVDPGPEVRWSQDENDPWVIARLTLTDKEKLTLLNEYLDIKNIEVSPENGSIEKNTCKEMNGHLAAAKFYDPYESDDSSSDRGISCTGGKSKKNKAARQFQTVAKQFGSIGRSMSKKLKHIGNIARRGGSFKGETTMIKRTSDTLKNKRTLSGLPMMSRTATVDGSLNPRQVVVAVLNIEKKHEYQKKLIQNYLTSAITRYENDKFRKNGTSYCHNGKLPALQCINPGCTMYSSPSTSYMCSTCYTKQKHTELELLQGQKTLEVINEGPLVVSGKSSFYTEVDKTVKESVEKLPVAGRLGNGTSEFKNSLFYDKFHCDNATYPSLIPDHKCPSSGLDSHSVLKTIEESSSI
ncbi:OTU domain-containing protein 7B [Araneus ventricosus]|uniref:ubiquitinyl hydrolase 1 n=1 Tax=Araneus ventricosus TaxID=182803 RepID=A0A4Y2G2F7_ARAVE|nr:OTU domain-containing protein 7B [Araneus ventricosus]